MEAEIAHDGLVDAVAGGDLRPVKAASVVCGSQPLTATISHLLDRCAFLALK